MRIAVLDTDQIRANQICAALGAIGHACSVFHGETIPEAIRREAFDLLILDWQFSTADDAMRAVRSWSPANVPVVVMAERNDENGIVEAIKAGASDYLIKPLRLGELVTRVQVLFKRAYPEQAAGEQVRFGSYLFETAAGRVTREGKVIGLTQKEFELALLFFRNLGRPLSRAYIQEAVWSQDPNVASRTMDTHVSRVRSKLGLKPESGFRLAPVYGYGYELEQLGD